MSEIYLGEDHSSSVRDWVMSNWKPEYMKSQIVWKEACNPDGTPLSNIASAVWLGSTGYIYWKGGETLPLALDYEPGTACIRLDNYSDAYDPYHAATDGILTLKWVPTT